MYHPVCPSLPHHVVLTGHMAHACLTYVATWHCTTLVLSPRAYLRCADGAVPHPHRISQALPFSPAPPCYGNLAFSKINVQASTMALRALSRLNIGTTALLVSFSLSRRKILCSPYPHTRSPPSRPSSPLTGHCIELVLMELTGLDSAHPQKQT